MNVVHMLNGPIKSGKNYEILLLATTSVNTNVECSTGLTSFWVKFPNVCNKVSVKYTGYARVGGGMGGFEIVHKNGMSPF